MLIVAPWSGFWDRNFFVDRLPSLTQFLASPVARGAVTGIGLITVLAGLAEFGAAFSGRRPRHETAPGPTVHSDR